VGDVVVLAALVLGGGAHGDGALLTQVWRAAEEWAEEQVHDVGEGDGDRVGGGVVGLGVMPTEERIPGLAGANGDGVLVVSQILGCGAFQGHTVASYNADVVAMRVEGIVHAAHAQVADDGRQRVEGGIPGFDDRQGAVRLARQPGSEVRRDGIGEATPVDHPIARMVILRIERLAGFHFLAEDRVDLGQQGDVFVVRVEGSLRAIVYPVRMTSRADDDRAEQAHRDLDGRVRTALIDEGARAHRHKTISHRAAVGPSYLCQRHQVGPIEDRTVRLAVREDVFLAREDQRDAAVQGVVQHHRDRVAFVHAQDRPGVLEVIGPVREAPHEYHVAVGCADVARVRGEREVRSAGADHAVGLRTLSRGGSGPARHERQDQGRDQQHNGHFWVCRMLAHGKLLFDGPGLGVGISLDRQRTSRVHADLGHLLALSERALRVRAAEVAVIEQVGVRATSTGMRRGGEDDVEAFARADGDGVGVVGQVGAVAAAQQGGVLADDMHQDAVEGHGGLHEAQVRETQQNPLSRVAGNERGNRLVLQVRGTRRGDQVAVRVEAQAVGGQRVGVDASVDQREVRLIVAPLGQLDVRVSPV